MNDFPRQALRRIVAKYGKEICSDARRCENLLNDLSGAYRREINVLITAVEEHVPLDLLAANRSTPVELLLKRLEKRLAEQTALTADAAGWAVESWALALNLTTENEIQARQIQIEPTAPQVIRTKTVPPNQSSAGEISPTIRNNPTRKPTITPPAPQQRTVPPVMRQQPPMPKSSPPVISPKNNPQVVPSSQTPTINQPKPVRTGFGIFRGCLIIVFLLAVASVALLFGVPYAIEVMRETQRERNEESPRFPSR